MTLESILLVEAGCALFVAAVVAWCGGASWRTITGIGDDPDDRLSGPDGDHRPGDRV